MTDDKPIYYWDSCIFFEWLNEEESATQSQRSAISRILADNEDRKNLIITSSITHLEVLPDKLNSEDAYKEEQYFSIFDGKRFLVLEIGENVIRLAREIRNYYYRPATADDSHKIMDLGDSIHLAAAVINGANEFHTRDNSKKGSKIPLVTLYEWSGEDKLIGKFPLTILSPEDDQADLFNG